MGTLTAYTEDLLNKSRHEMAWEMVQKNWDGRAPKRFINGIACSSPATNANGDAFYARGLTFTLPMLLLLNHNFTVPMGVVEKIDIRGDQVCFRAQLNNRAGPYWIDQTWEQIVSGEARCISMGEIKVLTPALMKSAFADWTIGEISVVGIGADTGARITKVSGRPAAVRLKGPNEHVYWSEGA